MIQNMEEAKKCLDCGLPMPPNVPGDVCPDCMFQRAISTDGPKPNVPDEGLGDIPVENASDFEVTEVNVDTVEVNPLASPQRFPGYDLLGLLGQGGMGQVYKGKHQHLHRMVAIKVLSPKLKKHTGFAERFLREARAMALLEHPNIAKVHDFGDLDGEYYFIMEYVDGTNLSELIKSNTLTPEESFNLVEQICDALDYAHGMGVVHRDIKPANILINMEGAVKVVDFGLVKVLDDKADMDFQLTLTNQVMGTPIYMAPEQRKNKMDVDHRADIYSVGVMFYQMLTGELPSGNFTLPSKKAKLHKRIDKVVLKAMEEEPGERYQNIMDIKTELTTAGFSTGSVPQESGSKFVKAFLILVILVASGAIGWFGIMAWQKSKGQPPPVVEENPNKPLDEVVNTPPTPAPPPEPEVPLEDVVAAKSQVELAFKELAGLPDQAALKARITDVDKLLIAANTFLDQKVYGKSLESFESASAAVAELKDVSRQRQEFSAAIEAMVSVEGKADIQRTMPTAWGEVQQLAEQARGFVDKEDFVQVNEVLATMRTRIETAHGQVGDMKKFQAEEAGWRRATAPVDIGLMEKHEKTAWEAVRQQALDAGKPEVPPAEGARLYAAATKGLRDIWSRVQEKEKSSGQEETQPLQTPFAADYRVAREAFSKAYDAADPRLMQKYGLQDMFTMNTLVSDAQLYETVNPEKGATLYNKALDQLEKILDRIPKEELAKLSGASEPSNPRVLKPPPRRTLKPPKKRVYPAELTVEPRFTDGGKKHLVRATVKINGLSRGTRLLPYTSLIREMGDVTVEVIPEDSDAWE
ncbi:MAG: serine/threonine-protein kinase, partial [Verrucomicrobiota bacterium]